MAVVTADVSKFSTKSFDSTYAVPLSHVRHRPSSLASMSIFTGGGPLSEPVRTVYRQIRMSLSVDPDIMATVEMLANRVVEGGSRSQAIESQAEDVRRAFNRRQFMECNITFFDHETLENAIQRYEEAKQLLEINPAADDRYANTALMIIFTSLRRHLNSRRFVPFLPY